MKKNLLLIASLIAVIILFQVCYGLKAVVPGNINWLMSARHDWGQHYLGWYFYRNEPWHWPLGQMNNFLYPLGTNIGFTDSIPLLAIFFKIFAPLLPADFQYLGMWLLVCHLLTAFFTIKLFNHFKVKPFFTFLAVIFITANPVLVYRGLHPALCGQWLLLASIYVYCLDPALVKRGKIVRYQLILLTVASLINPYLCWMVLGFTFATGVKLWKYERAISWKYLLAWLAGSLFSIFLLWYIVGMVSFGKKEALGVEGAYGLYSLNLNALYDPVGFSALVPQQKWVSWHQYEGYMYLGLGMFLLVFVLLAWRLWLFIKRRTAPKQAPLPATGSNKRFIPLLVLAVLYALFAITHVYTWNDKVLFRLPVPSFITQLGEVFRASARFFWTPYYLILIVTLIGISRIRVKPVITAALVLAALCLQLYDIKPLLTFRKLSYGAYTPPMDNKSWMELMKQFDEIIFYPAFETPHIRPMDYQDFCYLAQKVNKPINVGYVARFDAAGAKRFSDSLNTMVEDGTLSHRALYITNTDFLEHFSLALFSKTAQVNALDDCLFVYANGLHNKTLDSLSSAVNARNKGKLDSAWAFISNHVEFFASKPIPVSTGKPIHCDIEQVNAGSRSVSMYGWAFIDTTNNNKGDSLFITLSNATGAYMAPAKIVPRQDVTRALNKTYLDDAGFRVLAFCDSVKKGNYQLGIAIKNARGAFVYQSIDREARIGVSEYGRPERLTQLPRNGKIAHDMELSDQGASFKVFGWAALENQPANGHTIGVVLKSGDNIYAVPTELVIRHDVTEAVKNGFNWDSTGYVTRVLKSTLPKGAYELGLLVRDTLHKTESIVLAGKSVDIH